MAIQRPVPGMSYADLRKKNPPKRTERKALNIRQRDMGGEQEAEPNAQKRPSLQVVSPTAADAKEPAEVSAGSGPDTVNETLAKGTDEVSVETKSDERQDDGPEEARQVPEARPASEIHERPRKTVRKSRAEQDLIAVRGSIPVPAKGAFALFDAVSQHYGEAVALKAVLDEALKTPGNGLWENKLSEYPNIGKRLRAHRTVPAADYASYCRAVDPLGIMPSFKTDSFYLQARLARYYAT